MRKTLGQFSRRYLIADAAPLSARERWTSAAAAFFGMLLIQAVLTVLPVTPGLSYLLAPLGATSVILFALPHSPLAQPWSVVGGLLLSAVVGWLCGLWIQPAFLAVAVALGIAIWLTAWLRCLHPPGGAMAVVFALSAQQHAVSLTTAVLNTVAALAAVLAVNNLIPGRRYPQCIQTAPQRLQADQQRSSIRHEDLQYAIEKLDTYLDVSEDDLVRIYDLASGHAHRRHDRRCCSEIMSRDVHSVHFATELNEAWALMKAHHLKGVPVVDNTQRVKGVLTLDNFLRHVQPDPGHSIGDNIRRLIRPTASAYADKPEVAGQIMSEGIIFARPEMPVSELLGLISGKDFPLLIPVVDAQQRLAGVLSQSDLLTAIYQRQAAAAARNEARIDEKPDLP